MLHPRNRGLVSAAQGEGSGEVMSPRAGDALISEIAQHIAQEGVLTEKGRFGFFADKYLFRLQFSNY